MSAITSPAVVWNTYDDPHPARVASQRCCSAMAKGDLQEWLSVYAEDAVLEHPVGRSLLDPEGRGHHGHAGLTAFWERAVAPIASFEFLITGSFANRGSNACANVVRIRTTYPDGRHTDTDLVTVYVVDDAGLVTSMKAYWEPERTMAGFTRVR